jgi:hypothetical protein
MEPPNWAVFSFWQHHWQHPMDFDTLKQSGPEWGVGCSDSGFSNLHRAASSQS